MIKLHDDNVFVVCTDKWCNSGFLKKLRANTGTLCKHCKDQRGNHKRHAEHKKTNKNNRVAVDSSVNIPHLDSEELTQRNTNKK